MRQNNAFTRAANFWNIDLFIWKTEILWIVQMKSNTCSTFRVSYRKQSGCFFFFKTEMGFILKAWNKDEIVAIGWTFDTSFLFDLNIILIFVLVLLVLLLKCLLTYSSRQAWSQLRMKLLCAKHAVNSKLRNHTFCFCLKLWACKAKVFGFPNIFCLLIWS